MDILAEVYINSKFQSLDRLCAVLMRLDAISREAVMYYLYNASYQKYANAPAHVLDTELCKVLME